jgi:cell division septum initiation protein DivIVA
MLKFEDAVDEAVAPVAGEDEDAQDSRATETHTDPMQPVAVDESPTGAAARMLEIAAATAEELVAKAHTDADSLVTTAKAEADAILEASREQAQKTETELTRDREQQAAELDQERATALAGLAEEKAELESQIASLRSLQDEHRTHMRRHLEQQLEQLDLVAPDSPVADAS